MQGSESTDVHRASLHLRDQRGRAHLHSEIFELLLGAAREILGISGQHARSAFHEQNMGASWIDRAKLVSQGVAADLCQSTCEFNSSGTASNYNEVDIGNWFAFCCLPL